MLSSAFPTYDFDICIVKKANEIYPPSHMVDMVDMDMVDMDMVDVDMVDYILIVWIFDFRTIYLV